MGNYRFARINHTQDELETALKIVSEFACDKFIIDCTNGVVVTDGYNRAGVGTNGAAKILFERKKQWLDSPEGQQAIENEKRLQTLINKESA